MDCLDLEDLQSGWLSCGPDIPHAISRMSTCVMGNWVWLTGGVNGSSLDTLSSTYCWQPGRSQWEKMADMNDRRYGHAMVTDGTSLYVIGGSKETSPNLVRKSVEVYNTTINKWHKLASLPVGIEYGAAVFLPWGKMLLTGGEMRARISYKSRKELLLYSVSENRWTESEDHLGFIINGHGIVLLQPKQNTNGEN